MKTIISLFFIFSACCIAQNLPMHTPQDIMTTGGYLDICGLKDREVSKDTLAVMKSVPPDKVIEAIQNATNEGVADRKMCLAYIWGVIDGFKEGHEHGVLAPHFPQGIPHDPVAAFKVMPPKELASMGNDFNNDMPCVSEKTTNGQILETVNKYILDLSVKNPLVRYAPTPRMISWAVRDSFICPASQSPKQSGGESR